MRHEARVGALLEDALLVVEVLHDLGDQPLEFARDAGAAVAQ